MKKLSSTLVELVLRVSPVLLGFALGSLAWRHSWYAFAWGVACGLCAFAWSGLRNMEASK